MKSVLRATTRLMPIGDKSARERRRPQNQEDSRQNRQPKENPIIGFGGLGVMASVPVKPFVAETSVRFLRVGGRILHLLNISGQQRRVNPTPYRKGLILG